MGCVPADVDRLADPAGELLRGLLLGEGLGCWDGGEGRGRPHAGD